MVASICLVIHAFPLWPGPGGAGLSSRTERGQEEREGPGGGGARRRGRGQEGGAQHWHPHTEPRRALVGPRSLLSRERGKGRGSRSVVSDSSDPMDCSLPGFSIHGIFQARVLEWVAISFSRGSSQARNQTQVSCIASRFSTI